MPTTSPGSSFQSLMEAATTPSSSQATSKMSLQSPFELMPHSQMLATSPTFETILTQVKGANATLGDIQSQLNTPNMKLNQGRKYLLKNKLTDANTHLHAANSKLGVNFKEQKEEEMPAGPLGKFIKLITDGQNQLESAKQQLHALKDKGESLSPGDLLTIQLKMNTAQQNLEFSSMILSKAVEDMKMILQTQI